MTWQGHATLVDSVTIWRESIIANICCSFPAIRALAMADGEGSKAVGGGPVSLAMAGSVFDNLSVKGRHTFYWACVKTTLLFV